MYGEYDSGRYHTSSQDEDSGNFANSYPSYRSANQKWSSRLGKGGGRLKSKDIKTQSLSENSEELTNEESNSITGPEGASVMSWLRETPAKNEVHVKTNSSPPVAFRSVNTIHRSSVMHSEKSLINDYIGNIIPSGIPVLDLKSDKSVNPLFAPECKRSLIFKTSEQKQTVLQDRMNIDNIRKTPGSKLGVAHHHLDKDRRVTADSAREKENFVTNLFEGPNFGSILDTNLGQPKISQHLYMRKPSDALHSENSTKTPSPDVIDSNKKQFDNLDFGAKIDHKLTNHVSSSSCNVNQLLKNISEPLDLKIRENFNNGAGTQEPVTSNNFLSSHDNFISNSYASCFKDNSDLKPKASFPFIPVVSSSENFNDIKPIADCVVSPQPKHLFGYPFVQSENRQVEVYNDPLIFDKKSRENAVQHKLSDIMTPMTSATIDSHCNRSDSINTVTVIPTNEIDKSAFNKKSVENTDEKKSEKVKLTDVVPSEVNNAKQLHKSENKRIDNVPASLQNEQCKLPTSYASAVSMKNPVNADHVQKPIMAPPSTTNLMKPPQGPVKVSKTLLKTHSNPLSGARFNRPYNCASKVASNEKIFVNSRSYEVLSTLGKGGSSEVFLVLEPRSSRLMAVKCVNLSQVDKVIADGYLNEVELLLKLQGCESVIRMFDHEYVEDEKSLFVVMEKGDTDLSKLLRDISKTKNISMSMIIYYWTEMLSAVKDIHDKGIIHSDLKPANFLLVCGRLKLIDFGIASSLQGDMTSVHKEVTTGTWNYMSPEAIKNNGNANHGYKISYKSDVWSLGCILYNLIYGKTPFSHITNTWGKLMAIADASHVIKFPDEMYDRGKVPAVILETLKRCLTRDPKQRPSVGDLLNYDYYESSNVNLSKLDSSVKQMKDTIAGQMKSVLPLEFWGKVAQIISHDNVESIVGIVKTEIAEQIKNVLPLEQWEKISHVF